MTSSIQLAVVKCVPDPVRDEPRNVGVFAWRGKEFAARFIGEDEGGALDRRRVPLKVVADRQTYGDWVAYLRGQLEDGGVIDPLVGRRVSLGDPTFLESLAHVMRGGYGVRDAGEAITNYDWALQKVVAEAFERFVASDDLADLDEEEEEVQATARHKLLAYTAVRALRKKKYQERRDFVRHYPVFGKTQGGNRVPAVFDIGITAPTDLITEGRVLLVDAVSLVSAGKDVSDVVDRARAVATKAREIQEQKGNTLVRALVSNGKSGRVEPGRYAIQILEDDGGVETVTIDQLIDLVPKVRQGQI